MSASLNHIQVCCRIRNADDGQPQVTSNQNNSNDFNDSSSNKPGRSCDVITSNGTFQMDYAFDKKDNQEYIFDSIVQPLLTDAFAGFNCSLFSYGQTGSGKTYTLIGNAASGSINSNSNSMPSSDRDEERGIIPRAAEHIFSKQASLDPSKVSCHIKLSILEVYQEQLKDLLRSTTNTTTSNTTTPNTNTIQIRDTINSGLRIREQMDGIVWVENLTELCITEEVEFNRLMNTALKRRIIGTHAMNDISSRSHLCCIFNIYQVYHTTGVKINSKIHFIDLAGSEKVRKTDATGLRFSEAKHINKSLSALGNVIYALSIASRGSTDVNHNGTSGILGINATTTSNSMNVNPLPRVNSNISLTSNISTSNTSIANIKDNNNNNNTTTANITNNSNNNSNMRTHIPYRDSKLTRLLQNSLGGNAKTVIILTVSDAKKHLSETLSTLRFGARARQIQTKAIINRSIIDDHNLIKKQYTTALQENNRLKEIITELQSEIFTLKQNTTSSTINNTSSTVLQSNNKNQQQQQPITSSITTATTNTNRSEEQLCEICKDFMNMKLRGDHSSDTGAPSIPAINTSSSNRNSIATLSVYPSLDSYDASGYEDTDSTALLVDAIERCAICGLSAEEADKLALYTGEILGELFSCDGNCGHQFHVRCVGLVGEGGQYALPEGEWFCTDCYSATTTMEDAVDSSGGSSSSVAASTSALTAATPPLHSASSENIHHTHSEDSLQQSFKIAPNKNPSSVLATIKSEYHIMRKERNRILAQWQQEKRILEKYEISRRIEQQKKDFELITAKETIVQLEDIVTKGEAQSARMQKLFDIMLKELQLSTNNMNISNNNIQNSSSSAAIRNSVDRLKWASLTVDSLLDMPIDSQPSSPVPNPLSYPGTSSHQQPGSFSRSPLKHSATDSQLFTTSTTTGSGSTSGAGAGIPKPWKSKVRTGGSGSATSSVTSSVHREGGGTSSPGVAVDLHSSTTATVRNSESAGAVLPTQAPLHTSSVVPSPGSASPHTPAAGTPLATQQVSSSASGSSSTGTKPGTYTSYENAGRPRMSLNTATTSSSNNSNNNNSYLARYNANTTDKPTSSSREKASYDSETDSDTGRKSKFINPFKNRLKDLIKNVEAETDAFAEIRQKFRSREDERTQLRNSTEK